jgi:hypothetical protein
MERNRRRVKTMKKTRRTCRGCYTNTVRLKAGPNEKCGVCDPERKTRKLTEKEMGIRKKKASKNNG